MGRWKGNPNRHKFRMSQRVTYQGRKAEVINNTGWTLVKKIKIMIVDTGERLLVPEADLVKGWK
jgi:hypothetical protein